MVKEDFYRGVLGKCLYGWNGKEAGSDLFSQNYRNRNLIEIKGALKIKQLINLKLISLKFN